MLSYVPLAFLLLVLVSHSGVAQVVPPAPPAAASGVSDSIKAATASVQTDTAGLRVAYTNSQAAVAQATQQMQRLDATITTLAKRVDYLDGLSKARAEGDVARAKVRFSISLKVLDETMAKVDALQSAVDLAAMVGQIGTAANPLSYGDVSTSVQVLGASLTGDADNRLGNLVSLITSAVGGAAAVNPLIGGVVSVVSAMFSRNINKTLPGMGDAQDKVTRVMCASNNTANLFGMHQQSMGRIAGYQVRITGLRAAGVEVFARAAAVVGDTSSYDSYVAQGQVGKPLFLRKMDSTFGVLRTSAIVTPDGGAPKGYAEANAVVGSVREYIDHYEQVLAEIDAFYAETSSFGLDKTTGASVFPKCPALGNDFEVNLAKVRSAAVTARRSFGIAYLKRRTSADDRKELFASGG